VTKLSDLAKGPSPLAAMIGDLSERPTETIEVPGLPGKQVKLWVLTQSEETRCRKKAYEWVRDPKGLGFDVLDLEYDEQRALHDAIMCEVLAEALRDAENPHNAFAANGREVRDRLGSGRIQDLWRKYIDYARTQQDLQDVEDPEKELDELVKLVLQGFPLATRLSRYASPSLRTLLLSALDRLGSGPTASSSDGSSPSASGAPSSDA
jgi:hypothetical protein